MCSVIFVFCLLRLREVHFWTCSGEIKCTEMRAARATRLFPFLANKILILWRRCRSRRRFLNSLILSELLLL